MLLNSYYVVGTIAASGDVTVNRAEILALENLHSNAVWEVVIEMSKHTQQLCLLQKGVTDLPWREPALRSPCSWWPLLVIPSDHLLGPHGDFLPQADPKH